MVTLNNVLVDPTDILALTKALVLVTVSLTEVYMTVLSFEEDNTVTLVFRLL